MIPDPAHLAGRFDSTYEGLKHEPLCGVLAVFPARFDSTYEGLKLALVHYEQYVTLSFRQYL